MYLDAEVGRMQAEADRRAGIRTPVPRAEPDQVVRSAVRDDQGRILGRYAGAITAGMTNKTDVLGMRSMMPNAPTNEGSTYQNGSHGYEHPRGCDGLRALGGGRE